MKKLILLYIICILALTGCSSSHYSSSRREPDELDLIRSIGIDASEKGFLVTIVTDSGLSQGSPTIRSGEGPTIDAALNVMKKMSSGQEPFYSQTGHIVIGEELAQRGIDEVLDFMGRSSEIRIDSNVFLARETTAQELLTGLSADKIGAADSLELFQMEVSGLGQGYVFTALDIATALSQRGSALIQAAVVMPGDNVLEPDVQRVLPNGFGVLSGGKLVGYVSADVAPSVTMLTGNLDYMNLQADFKTGKVGMGLNDNSVKFSPVFVDDKLEKLSIKVDTEVNVTEVGGEIDISSEKVRREMGMTVSNQILTNLQAALSHSKDLGVDYMGIGRKAEIKAPLKFAAMNKKWEEIFPTLPIEIEVNTVVKRTFDLGKPISVKG